MSLPITSQYTMNSPMGPRKNNSSPVQQDDASRDDRGMIGGMIGGRGRDPPGQMMRRGTRKRAW